MRKKVVYVAVALVMAIVAGLNVKTMLDANRTYDLTMISIDALSEDGGSGEGGSGESDTGATVTTSDECHRRNGYWNMALQCTDSGIEDVTCSIDGELTVWQQKIFSFSYKQGKSYKVVWERWACVLSTGNCCLSDKQGIRIIG